METIGLIGIALSLILIVILALRGANIFLAAMICAVIVAAFNGQPVFAAFTQTFMASFGDYVIKNLTLFMIGAVFGVLMDISGNAQAIAKLLVDKIGKEHGLLAIIIATAVLVYGGVSLFVIAFTIYPIAVAVCREANIPKRFIPGVIAYGAFTFATYAIPGSPQIGNALFMPYYGTTLYAAPVIGMLGAIVEIGIGVAWFTWRLKKARAMHEGYGEHEDNLDSDENVEIPAAWKAFSPIVLFVALNIWLTYFVFPSIDLSYLKDLYGVTAKNVIGTWALLGAVGVACVYIIIINYKTFKGRILEVLAKGVENSIAPMINTAAVVGFGGVVAAAVGFKLVSELLLGISDNPIIAEVISLNVLCGITGSASGGIGITLTTFGATFAQMAQNTGVSLDVLHRVGAIAAGGMDSFPHNGGIITILYVCGLTHKESYIDMGVTTVIVPIIATIVVTVAALSGLQC